MADVVDAPKTKLFVRYKNSNPSEDELRSVFSKHGKIVEMNLYAKFCFIEYESENSALAAIDAENEALFKGIKLEVEITVRNLKKRNAGEDEDETTTRPNQENSDALTKAQTTTTNDSNLVQKKRKLETNGRTSDVRTSAQKRYQEAKMKQEKEGEGAATKKQKNLSSTSGAKVASKEAKNRDPRLKREDGAVVSKRPAAEASRDRARSKPEQGSGTQNVAEKTTSAGGDERRSLDVGELIVIDDADVPMSKKRRQKRNRILREMAEQGRVSGKDDVNAERSSEHEQQNKNHVGDGRSASGDGTTRSSKGRSPVRESVGKHHDQVKRDAASSGYKPPKKELPSEDLKKSEPKVSPSESYSKQNRLRPNLIDVCTKTTGGRDPSGTYARPNYSEKYSRSIPPSDVVYSQPPDRYENYPQNPNEFYPHPNPPVEIYPRSEYPRVNPADVYSRSDYLENYSRLNPSESYPKVFCLENPEGAYPNQIPLEIYPRPGPVDVYSNPNLSGNYLRPGPPEVYPTLYPPENYPKPPEAYSTYDSQPDPWYQSLQIDQSSPMDSLMLQSGTSKGGGKQSLAENSDLLLEEIERINNIRNASSQIQPNVPYDETPISDSSSYAENRYSSSINRSKQEDRRSETSGAKETTSKSQTTNNGKTGGEDVDSKGSKAGGTCEIIITDSLLKLYALKVASKIHPIGIKVQICVLPPGMTITEELEDAIQRDCLFAVIITDLHKQHNSVTVDILHGVPEEHRNMLIEDAVTLISKNYDEYLKVLRGGGGVTTTTTSNEEVINKMLSSEGTTKALEFLHPDDVTQCLIIRLADKNHLTEEEIEKIIEYLKKRQDNMKAMRTAMTYSHAMKSGLKSSDSNKDVATGKDAGFQGIASTIFNMLKVRTTTEQQTLYL